VIPAAGDAPVKIRLSHLTKRFRTKAGVFTAIDDVSVEIAAGSFFMIVGPSRANRSSTG
jgi:ABC-type oligopeptide transport system ATPase subunit